MAILRLDAERPTDIETFRTIRLRALATDPAAFGSTYACENAFDDATWQMRLGGFAGRAGAVLVADSFGGTAGRSATPEQDNARVASPLLRMPGMLGMVGVGLSEWPGDATVWGMWVAPEGRRIGLGGRLLAAAEQWAAHAGAATVTLWVHGANVDALDFYRARGYAHLDPSTPGLRAPDGCVEEQCLRRAVLDTKI